jgi:archaellum biogenesis ATPase FlaH
LGDSQVLGCSDKLSDILGSSCNIFGVTKPNANIKAITNSINLKDENLTKKDVVIICSGTRDVTKNEAKDGLRSLSEFAKLTSKTKVIVTCVPHCFDLQPSSCINKEVE